MAGLRPGRARRAADRAGVDRPRWLGEVRRRRHAQRRRRIELISSRARASARAGARAPPRSGVVLVHAQAQDVQLALRTSCPRSVASTLLISTPATSLGPAARPDGISRPGRPRAARDAGERVVVGDRHQREPGDRASGGRARRARGRRPTRGVAVEVDRALRSVAQAASLDSDVDQAGRSARVPVAAAGGGVDVDEQRVEDDRPLPDLEARRQAVDEARQDGRGLEADDALDGPGHAQVR